MFTSRSTNTIPAPITTATLLLLCTNVNTITTTATAVAGTVSWQITQLLRTDATSVATTTLALLDSNPSYQHRPLAPMHSHLELHNEHHFLLHF
jgi:hypothetical protein